MKCSKSCLENHTEIFISWRWGQVMRFIPEIKGENTLQVTSLALLLGSPLLQPFCNSDLQPQDPRSSLQRGFHQFPGNIQQLDGSGMSSRSLWWPQLVKPLTWASLDSMCPIQMDFLVLSDPGHSVTPLSCPCQPCLSTWLTDCASPLSALCCSPWFHRLSPGTTLVSQGHGAAPKIQQIPWKNRSSPAAWCFCASPVCSWAVHTWSLPSGCEEFSKFLQAPLYKTLINPLVLMQKLFIWPERSKPFYLKRGQWLINMSLRCLINLPHLVKYFIRLMISEESCLSYKA